MGVMIASWQCLFRCDVETSYLQLLLRKEFMTIEYFGVLWGGSAFRQIRPFQNSNVFWSK